MNVCVGESLAESIMMIRFADMHKIYIFSFETQYKIVIID